MLSSFSEVRGLIGFLPYHRSNASRPTLARLARCNARAFCLVTLVYTARLGAECDWLLTFPRQPVVFSSLCAWPHVLTCTKRAWLRAGNQFFCTAGSGLAAPFCIVRARPTTPCAKPNMDPASHEPGCPTCSQPITP
jgi:hypothetical protein